MKVHAVPGAEEWLDSLLSGLLSKITYVFRGSTRGLLAPADGAKRGPARNPVRGSDALQGAAENLVKLLPAEATGFYLGALAIYTKPPEKSDLLLYSILAMILMFVARLVAKAGIWSIIFTAFAFLLWMGTIDNGVLRVYFPDLCKPPRSTVIVGFYTGLVTLLSSCGKIK